MGKMPRKDYGADAIVDPSQETVKRWNNVNTPFSVESTGLERRKDLYVESADISYDTIKVNSRVYTGNQEGVVTAVTTSGVDPDFVLETVTISLTNEGEGSTRDITYTVAELKAAGNIFFSTL